MSIEIDLVIQAKLLRYENLVRCLPDNVQLPLPPSTEIAEDTDLKQEILTALKTLKEAWRGNYRPVGTKRNQYRCLRLILGEHDWSRAIMAEFDESELESGSENPSS